MVVGEAGDGEEGEEGWVIGGVVPPSSSAAAFGLFFLCCPWMVVVLLLLVVVVAREQAGAGVGERVEGGVDGAVRLGGGVERGEVVDEGLYLCVCVLEPT